MRLFYYYLLVALSVVECKGKEYCGVKDMGEELHLTEEQKKELLRIARAVVESYVKGESAQIKIPDEPAFKQKAGCFVTLHTNGQLRGCIGTFSADKPLVENVIEMARAALEDPRFPHMRLRADELDKLDIEISVLSPMWKVEDPLSLELGKHGIYIRRGYRSGCFLPQVASETGWSKEEFLSYCCSHKAGLEPDAWKNPDTEVYLFTAEVFSEKELLGK